MAGPRASAAAPHTWAVLLVACLGMATYTLDVSSFTIAMPALPGAFDRAPDSILWLNLAPTLVSTGIAFSMGRLGDALPCLLRAGSLSP